MNRFVIRYPQFKRKALTLSYDDGVVQDKRFIEMLDRYGLKCTFNLMGYKLTQNKDWPEFTCKPSISREEAPSVYQNHEVAVHGFQHPYLDELPAGNAAWQIIKDRETLEALFGRIIRGMAYPMGGTQSEALVNTLRACGILYARTSKCTHGFSIPKDWLRLTATCRNTDPECLDLAKKYVQQDVTYLSQMFYMWGHTYEFDEGGGWNQIEEFCKIVANHDDIWYSTNGEIFEYLDAANRLICSADGKLLCNPTAATIYLENFHAGSQHILHSGETIQIA